MISKRVLLASAAAIVAATLSFDASAQEKRTFSFGYDQPKPTAYGWTGDYFEKRLAELSKGTMAINQFPGGQLGQEPQMLQKIRAGDIDFIITATANGASITPQMGVLSLHFLFENEAHLAKAIGSKELNDLMKEMVAETVQGAKMLTLITLGFRNIYSKQPVTKMDDFKGKKVRVQATKTEDTHFPAYGAIPVHMPFGEVYTSLQTGVVDMAENGVNVYQTNKHYEVAPVYSMTQHEANNNLIWVSQKTWDSLNAEQKGWVETVAAEIGAKEPAYALNLEQESAEKLKKLGVKIVDGVDKSAMITAAKPIQLELAKELGPYAVKVVELVGKLK